MYVFYDSRKKFLEEHGFRLGTCALHFKQIICVRRDIAGTVDHENERGFTDGDGVWAETAVDDGEQLCNGIGTEGILVGVVARGIDMRWDMVPTCLPKAQKLVLE